MNLHRRIKAALGLGTREGASPPPVARTEGEALEKLIVFTLDQYNRDNPPKRKRRGLD